MLLCMSALMRRHSHSRHRGIIVIFIGKANRPRPRVIVVAAALGETFHPHVIKSGIPKYPLSRSAAGQPSCISYPVIFLHGTVHPYAGQRAEQGTQNHQKIRRLKIIRIIVIRHVLPPFQNHSCFYIITQKKIPRTHPLFSLKLQRQYPKRSLAAFYGKAVLFHPNNGPWLRFFFIFCLLRKLFIPADIAFPDFKLLSFQKSKGAWPGIEPPHKPL